MKTENLNIEYHTEPHKCFLIVEVAFFNDEKALVRLCNRDRDANGIEND